MCQISLLCCVIMSQNKCKRRLKNARMQVRELVFRQQKQGYRYNIDTFLLYDFATRCNLRGKVLDVGCGCGIVGILLKVKFAEISLFLLDILKQNCDLTRQNLKDNDIEAQVLCANFSEFVSDEKFDFIVSNPPFYRQGALKATNKHTQIGKFASSLSLESFVKSSNALLKPQGKLYFCYEVGALQELCAVLATHKLKITRLVFVHKNAHEKARLALIEAKKSSKSPCEVSSFFVYENGKLSAKMQEIYTTIRIKSLDI